MGSISQDLILLANSMKKIMAGCDVNSVEYFMAAL